MSVDVSGYLAMERAAYAEMVSRSRYEDEAFTAADSVELVVGWYAQHERFDYERWLLDGITVGPEAVALEYGCGPGRMLRRIAQRFSRVDGIDISPEVIEVARQRCVALPTPPQLFVTDGQDVPVVRESYDLAYSVICLQHICVHVVRRRIFEGLFRALKPGGVLTFQMGYGPGHAARVDYFYDYLDAKGTNGAVDVTVLHPAELAIDLWEIGFRETCFTLTPTGPGDNHAAWIFFRAVKPGSSASVAFSERDWRDAGFEPAIPDRIEMDRARRRQIERGLIKRSRDEASTIAALRGQMDAKKHERQAEREGLEAQAVDLKGRIASQAKAIAVVESQRSQLEDTLMFAAADRDFFAHQAAELTRECGQLKGRLDIVERQLRRVRMADRRRVRALIEDLVAEAVVADLKVGVLGAGAHTTWLLAETSLGSIRGLQFFDRDPSSAAVAGQSVRPSADLSDAKLDAIVVSSLAFQDELQRALASLALTTTRIICCYP